MPPTAFGKTVAAIGLIAERKVNTLILVHTKALLDQWKSRLEEFLQIDFTEDDLPKKRGRKKAFSPFGTLDFKGEFTAWENRYSPDAILPGG